MTPDGETLAFYDRRAGDYADLVAETAAGKRDHLSEFIARLQPGNRVLDLGCGPGHAAAAMQRAGMTVDATDASGAMVRLARRHENINVRLQGFADLDANGIYHGIWASFSLLHAPKSSLPAHLAACHRALQPGGLLALGMKLGEGEKRDELGRFYAYYTCPELDDLLADAGFTPIGHAAGLANGMTGEMEPYMVITAHA